MKKLRNKKGFTLIELLAVIVILGVLMMLAIPSMTQLIENSRKKTYITTAQSYIRQVRFEALSDIYQLPGVGKYIVVPISRIELESGQKKSPYGGAYVDDKSYVVIVNIGVPSGSTTQSVKYYYFVAMLDELGNGIELKEENSLSAGDIKRGTLSISSASTSGIAGGLKKASLTAACQNCADESDFKTTYTLDKSYY